VKEEEVVGVKIIWVWSGFVPVVDIKDESMMLRK
jgi:hypothetical protein